jgi:hypothetical protein
MPAGDASSAAVHVLSARLDGVPPGGEAGGPLPGLAEFLAAVPDHRRAQGRRHSLVSILGLACAATVVGAKLLVAIAEWAAGAIWFGITTGYFTIAGGRHHIPRKFAEYR